MSEEPWIAGNHIEVLENGEEFFPAVFSAIESAQREILIETFILFEDKVGLALHSVLVGAATRGVQIDITIDGFGSPDLSSHFITGLTAAGIRIHVFDPPPRLSRRLRPFRRMHRKIVIVDAQIGFIGGLNFSADHLADFGPEAKQDYAVRVQGPIVEKLRRLAQTTIAPHRPESASVGAGEEGTMKAQLVVRDNHRHRDDIERQYRRALHRARREVIIANAYFFPGFLLLSAMRRAARRGVKVRLILQGRPDMAIVSFAARLLYDHLLRAGVLIYEYCDRPMHGKVALVDEDWATVGSSNLDPLSLALNLEANVVVLSHSFNAQLRAKLEPLIQDSCVEVCCDLKNVRRWWWHLGIGYLAFHLLRKFPRWAARLPAHRPTVTAASQCSRTEPASHRANDAAWQWRGSD